MYRERVLLRRYREGQAAIAGFLDDYAFLAQGLIDLYETGFELRYLEAAEDLTRRQMTLFRNPETGAFYATQGNDGKLWMRMEDGYDGAEPSGNSVAAMNLLRLAEFGDRKDWREAADQMMRAFSARVEADPEAYPGILMANGYRAAPGKQIVLVGARGAAMNRMLRVVLEKFLPHKILLLVSSRDERRKLAARIEVVESMTSLNGKPTAYVCENYSCKLPVNQPSRLAELLQ